MKKNLIVAGVLAASLTFGISSVMAADASAAKPAAGGMQLTEFKPGLDDAMTMMVQPRHLKLHSAGEAQNWEMAAFQLRELRASFRRIGQYIPRYRNASFDENVANIMNPVLQQVDDAIKEKDVKKFTAAYAHMTDGCNACHTATEHAWIVMKVPNAKTTALLYPDQDFNAPK
jgi:hypothetical protein